jgi:hypothetical protein
MKPLSFIKILNLRSIATSYGSMVNNAEIFLNKLIKPLVKECEFSVRNTKGFKEIFLEKN